MKWYHVDTVLQSLDIRCAVRFSRHNQVPSATTRAPPASASQTAAQIPCAFTPCLQRHGRHQRVHAGGGRAAASRVPEPVLHRWAGFCHIFALPKPVLPQWKSCGGWSASTCPSQVGGLCALGLHARQDHWTARLSTPHTPISPNCATGVNDWGLRCVRRLSALRCLNLDSRHFTGGWCLWCSLLGGWQEALFMSWVAGCCVDTDGHPSSTLPLCHVPLLQTRACSTSRASQASSASTCLPPGSLMPAAPRSGGNGWGLYLH